MKQHWLVRASTIRLLWAVLLSVLALVVLAGVFIEIHPRFQVDGSFAFHAWYGFMTCTGMVVIAKVLGRFLRRKDSYYDRD